MTISPRSDCEKKLLKGADVPVLLNFLEKSKIAAQTSTKLALIKANPRRTRQLLGVLVTVEELKER